MNSPNRLFSFLWLGAMFIAGTNAACGNDSFASVVDAVQPKMVKVYGAGGVKRLEAYHSGIVISPDGHILTAWSYVLDTDNVSVTLADGRRFLAKIVGLDPKLEIAVLKIEADQLPCFDLAKSAEVATNDTILAFSNLYGVAAGDEQVSVQHGIVAGKMELAARRGAFATPYRGAIYVLDAITNNPGAAGGALTDAKGQLAGLLGKELRSSVDNTWLNYALPIGALRTSVDDILAGKLTTTKRHEDAKQPKDHYTLSSLGIELVPDVLAKTPPFIDRVVRDTPAAKAGLKADDLIIFVGPRIAPSCKAVVQELGFIDRFDEVRLTVQRGQELLEVTLRAN